MIAVKILSVEWDGSVQLVQIMICVKFVNPNHQVFIVIQIIMRSDLFLTQEPPIMFLVCIIKNLYNPINSLYSYHLVMKLDPENLHSATCDYCESVIFGIRHKCINCPDFDLCSNCICMLMVIIYLVFYWNKNYLLTHYSFLALAPTQHPNHTFMPIHRPGEPEIKIPGITFFCYSLLGIISNYILFKF